jgi:hypothetical protein
MDEIQTTGAVEEEPVAENTAVEAPTAEETVQATETDSKPAPALLVRSKARGFCKKQGVSLGYKGLLAMDAKVEQMLKAAVKIASADNKKQILERHVQSIEVSAPVEA